MAASGVGSYLAKLMHAERGGFGGTRMKRGVNDPFYASQEVLKLSGK